MNQTGTASAENILQEVGKHVSFGDTSSINLYLLCPGTTGDYWYHTPEFQCNYILYTSAEYHKFKVQQYVLCYDKTQDNMKFHLLILVHRVGKPHISSQ